MTKLRISAKTLGELALPGFCPRCAVDRPSPHPAGVHMEEHQGS